MEDSGKDDQIIKYVDLRWVKAEADEKIVGIGFTKVHNRLGPYILTIKK